MKVKLTLVNDSGCDLDTIEAGVPVRDGQFAASELTYFIARWQLQDGDTIRVRILDPDQVELEV